MNSTIKNKNSTPSRWLKSLTICLALGLTLCLAAAVFLYERDAVKFPQKMHAQSRQHLKVLLAIEQMQSALKIHKKAQAELTGYGGAERQEVMRQAQKQVYKNLAFLEQANKNQFNLTPSHTGPWQENFSAALENFILMDFKKTRPERDLPILHGLFTQNFKNYFSQFETPLEHTTSAAAKRSPARGIESMRPRDQNIFMGLDRLKHVYEMFFWSEQKSFNQHFFQQTRLAFYALLSASAVFLFFLVHFLRHLWLVNASLWQRNNELCEGHMQDTSTGLLNKNGFEHFAQRELERARRHGEHAAFVALRVEPFKEITTDWGVGAATEIIKSVAQVIHKSFRAYDNSFRLDANTFLVVLPQTNIAAAPSFLARLKTALHQKYFSLSNRSAVLMPKIQAGVSIYPSEGLTSQELLQSALSQLTETFELARGHEPMETIQSASEEPDPHLSVEERAVNDSQLPPQLEKTKQPETENSEILFTPTPEVFITEPATGKVQNDNDLPDVIQALNQELLPVEDLLQNPQENSVHPPTQAQTDLEQHNPVHIKVLSPESQKVIMIDFDGEKYDLAQNFRKKIKQTRQKI